MERLVLITLVLCIMALIGETATALKNNNLKESIYASIIK